LTQTYGHWELLLIDDHSQDHTAQVVKTFQQKISPERFQYFSLSGHGVSAARNFGIKNSSSELLAFLDSDDQWLPEKLSLQVKALDKNPKSALCHTEEIWIRRGKRVNPCKHHAKSGGHIFQKCLPRCVISPSATLIRRSVLDEVGLFDEMLPVCEDYDLWLRIGAKYPIHLITEPLIIKRNGHDGQQSQKFWGMDRFRVVALKKMMDSGVLSEENHQATEEILKQKCLVLANGCEKRGKHEEAEKYRNFLNSKYEVFDEISSN